MDLTLAEIQAAMARSIRTGEAVPESFISVPAGVNVKTRLQVYSDGYPARIAEALAETFPATAHILGDATFAALAERFVSQLQNAPRNLNDIGSSLGRFLSVDSLCDSLPFLPDLAALESAIQRAFHSRETTPFDGSRCSHWLPEDWMRARIVFQPSVMLLRSEWPLSDLHDAQEVDRESIDIDLSRQPRQFLVYRMEFNVKIESVSEIEAYAVEEFKRGVRLGEVVGSIAERGADAGAVAQLFSRWSSLGLVISCETEDVVA
jgi:hypothetical protein